MREFDDVNYAEDGEAIRALMIELGFGDDDNDEEEDDEDCYDANDELTSSADKKWVQKAVKHPGRFDGWSLSKMKKRYNTLKDKKDKSKSEMSEMRALSLGIRFKGSDVPGGKKKKGL